MPGAQLVMSGDKRSEYGCIVTAREQETDARIVLHRTGYNVIAQICDELDALEGDWRVLSYSTPATVYRDLQGTRQHEWKDTMQYPEEHVLGRIGRLDLLDPSMGPRLVRGRTHG